MTTIWRYNFDVDDAVTIKAPLPARVLRHVEASGPGLLSVWVEVTPGREQVERHLLVVGTGNPMPLDAGDHVGTVVALPFVWHVFEATR